MKTSLSVTWGTIFLALYLAFIFILAWKGYKKTKDMASFAIAKKISPIMLAIVYAASYASAGSFVGIPGNTYAVGFSGIWYSMCQWAPAIISMIVIGKGYRRLSAKLNNLSIAEWIGSRYNDKTLGNFISVVMVMQIFQIAGQLAGCAIVGQTLFGWSYHEAVVLAVAVIMIYITFGGSYAHYYTNYFQGAVMAVLSVGIFIAVWSYFPTDPVGSYTQALAAIDPSFTNWFSDKMADYSSPFIVMSGLFTVHLFWGFNPHLISKFQSIEKEKDMRKFILASAALIFVYGLASQAGLAARVMDPTMQYVTKSDQAMTFFLANRFPEIVGGFGLLVIWAAAMSTTDGIVVLLSTLVAKTFYFEWYATPQIASGKLTEENAQKTAFRWTTLGTPLICLLSLAVAWNQPAFMTDLIWISSGAMMSATVGPVFCGIYMRKASKTGAWFSAICGIIAFAFFFFSRNNLGIGVFTAASYGAVASFVMGLIGCKFLGTPVDQTIVGEMFSAEQD